MIDWYPPDEAIPGEPSADRHPPTTTPLPGSGTDRCGCVRETCLHLATDLGWSDADRVALGRAADAHLGDAMAHAPDGPHVLAVAEAWCALRHPVRGRPAANPALALAAMRQRFGSGAEAAILRALGRQLALRIARDSRSLARQA